MFFSAAVWSVCLGPDAWGMPGPPYQKEYAVMEMEISALGYLQKMEGGVLERPDPTVYRWHGPLRHEERDSHGRLLYRVSGLAEGRFL